MGDERAQHRASLPRIDDMPIPRGVQPGPGWTEQMREMADHIGGYATLCLVAAHGGRQVHVPREPARSPFRDCVDQATAKTLAWVYGGTGNRLDVPVGKLAVSRARRAGVLAAVRAGRLTGADAAIILGTSRTYLAHLVNHTNEGVGISPVELPELREATMLRLAALLARMHLTATGAAASVASAASSAILGMAEKSHAELRTWLGDLSSDDGEVSHVG